MIEQTTPALGLQLPHPANELAADVVRVRAALNALDAIVSQKFGAAEVSAAIAAAVDSAPGALDTLNELAAALGDDPQFATTVLNAIAAVRADSMPVDRQASATVLGGIKLGAGLSIDENGVASVSSYTRAEIDSQVPTKVVKPLEYDDRAQLRTTTGHLALVEGLGLFQHVAGSTEPDDDESCFATPSGRWLLQAAHWDLVDAWQAPDAAERDEWDEDEPLRFASSFASKVLTGTATCAITSVATEASTSFTGTVTGAAVGDRVIATPPAQLGATAAETGRLSYHAWVSAANTVTVMLTNASAAAANTNTAIQTAWPITVIKA